MRLISSLSLLFLCAWILVLPALADEHTKESLPEVRKKVDSKKAVLVDVREPREWKAGHVKGAISLPLSSLQEGITEEKLKSLPRDKTLYIYCVKGVRAMTAGALLKKQGFDVQVLKPGNQELLDAGFPSEK
jgi:rhodanese-related sulfurtransferase